MPAPGSKKKQCPYCEEEIPLAATVCRFCREELPKQAPDAPAAKEGPRKAVAKGVPNAAPKKAKSPANPSPSPSTPTPVPWNEDDGPPNYAVREEEEPEERARRKRRSDDDEDEPPPRKRKRPSMLDEFDEDSLSRRKSGRKTRFAHCPSCGSRDARRIVFTIWGSFWGPLLLCHVRCQRCNTAYNGRSGNPNTTGIALILIVDAVIAGLCALAGVLAYMAMKQ